MNYKEPWIFKAIPYFIGFCFLAVIGGWIAMAYIGVQIANHPHEFASGAGSLVKDFVESTGLLKP